MYFSGCGRTKAPPLGELLSVAKLRGDEFYASRRIAGHPLSVLPAAIHLPRRGGAKNGCTLRKLRGNEKPCFFRIIRII